MDESADAGLERYQRQTAFAHLGVAGQKRLAGSTALIVGVGGLGSRTAELLARAGVGRLRLVDADRVELVNLHRQGLYDESHAAAGKLKVEAAAERLKRINSGVEIESVAQRVDAGNIAALADGAGLILDGTDDFATRFLINDYCVRAGVPWVLAGVVRCEAQTMTIVPGRTACLRCVLDAPPPREIDPRCNTVGVLGPAVAAVAAIQANEAIKVLAGRLEAVSPYLLKLDLWTNTVQRIDTAAAREQVDCVCCKQGRYDYLKAP
ncbi:MAG TPA: HesA/MoeB/ThiF family protein [Phycisphaerae bacterium]|nr:HesA/MoeB/ThiF family protein [Phycisphaerae bacterium]